MNVRCGQSCKDIINGKLKENNKRIMDTVATLKSG